MNEILCYHPIIIGEWAVYFYNQGGLGSRDIDVLLPNWEMRDRVINTYLVNNGYELREKAFGEAEWVKFLEPGNTESETYLDVCTLQDKNIVHGRGSEIPWSIATEWQRDLKIEGTNIFIPEPEPLLVLKAKAAWDRSYDLMKKGGDEFLRDKIRKDRFDILSILSNCEINQEIIIDIVSKFNFKECFDDTLVRALSEREVIERHGFTDDKVSEMKKKLTKFEVSTE